MSSSRFLPCSQSTLQELPFGSTNIVLCLSLTSLTFSHKLIQAHGVIEMPVPSPELLIFEPFIETDEIIVSPELSSGKTHDFLWDGNSRWVEITVGVIGKRGSMRSLTPSITVKENGDILSLEEKFQGIPTKFYKDLTTFKLLSFHLDTQISRGLSYT